MPIRLSGLTSGLDTEAIVSELVNAYSMKTEKYKKEQTKLEWKQESWKTLNAKIYSLYTNVGNYRYDGAYSLKKATISDATKATVSASGSAITTSQKLNILSTAQASYITGAKLSKSDVNGDTTLKDLGYTGETTSISILKKDGTKTSIEVKQDTKIEDFIKALKENGLNANFDTESGRFFVSAKETGLENDFALSGDNLDGQKALTLLGLNTSIASVNQNGDVEFTAAGSYYKYYYDFYDTDEATTRTKLLDIVARFDEAKRAYDDANTKRGMARAELQDIKEREDEAKKDLEAYTVITNFKNNLANNTDSEVDFAASLDSLTDESLMADYPILSQTDRENILAARDAYKRIVTEGPADGLTIQETLEKNISDIGAEVAAKQAEVDEYTADMEEAATAMDENPLQGILRSSTGNIYGAERREREINDFLSKVMDAAAKVLDPAFTANGATKVAGTDAVIVLNGVKYTQSSNSFSINGLNINCIATTGEGDNNALTVGVATDAQAIYDKIKELFSQYNSVINEMTKLFNAESAKDYEPLTDDEKSAMSEKEIEKWESKIKSALLRRDSSLESVMSAMTTAMSRSYNINGKNYALSSFGIMTLGYLNSPENEQNAFHINGDEDDENSSGKEEKLMKAINEDPETVVEFFKNLTKDLYEAIDDKMKGTSLSSTYKVYNDKEMDKQYNNYKKVIAAWEKKVSQKEDYYYKKFTAMEKAMAQMDSQTNSLAGLLGSK